MPEGPSIVIAREEMQQFVGEKIKLATGNAKFEGKLDIEQLKGQTLQSVQSWGKHLILNFDTCSIRNHFLMFGSYRINDPKTHLSPRLELKFKPKGQLDFYASAMKLLDGKPENIYDWSADLMSDKWDPAKALKKIKALPAKTMICDALMSQEIFAGLGNIMKNEILYRVRIHPEKPVAKLKSVTLKKIVKEARIYAFQFYEWKKKFELKKHWEIMRKKTCPKGHKILRKSTGKGHRLSFICERCQPIAKS